MEDAIPFYESKGRLLLLTIGSLLFGGAGVYFSYSLFKGGSFFIALIMLLCGGFFLFFLSMHAKKFLTGEPHVVITPEYLQLYVLPAEKINFPWEDIEGYIPYRIESNSFIGLVLKNEERYAKLMPKKMKKLSRMSVRMGYPQYNIVFSHLKEKQLLLDELEKRVGEIERHKEDLHKEKRLNNERA
ncbi:STM3941 family protein [Pseudalkalibacillus hwajinpoensis]|uniref:STM3941 family protein n=1 Tax=Guptibacillus hwajinpoensis TaxID=208199 RepID=UPI001CFC5824